MTYRDPNPNSKLGAMRAALYELWQEHRRAGMLPTSSRFLYYELVANGVIQKADKRAIPVLHDALTDLRKSGAVPWTDIVDETRSLESFIGAVSIAQWMNDVLEQARLDPWYGEPPLVITESRSLVGALRQTAEEYAVRIVSTNGQAGGFLHTDLIPILRPGAQVLYFGDWDLAGGDIEANTRGVLEREVGMLQWRRLALTEQQVKRYKLPPKPKDDKRFKNDRGLHEAVETEALSQARIVKILRAALDALLPEPLLGVLERESRQRKAIQRKLR